MKPCVTTRKNSLNGSLRKNEEKQLNDIDFV
jgi:hypothetical protein